MTGAEKRGIAFSGQPIMLRPALPRLVDFSLPDDIAVAPPPSGAPAGTARFLGAWVGYWGESLPHLLVVERLRSDGGVQALYVVGSTPELGTKTWPRLSGKIAAGRLILDSSRAKISYTFEPKGRLLGRFEMNGGGAAVGVFEPIELAELRNPDRVIPNPALGETVRIPHRSAMLPDGSRPIELEGTLYRPPGAEAAPLAIINHGSTGGYRIDPTQTMRHEAEALWLLERGFAVLVPMRRGRGRSEGIFGEELDLRNCAPGLAEAVEDLASAMAYGCALPCVQRRPVLLLGQSRGGFLSTVFAARDAAEVGGVISFAGGWVGRSPFNDGSFNTEILAEAGATARVPQLWIYGERDSHYSAEHIEANRNAFMRVGGAVAVKTFSVPGDGHFVITFPDRWRPSADAYLDGL
jgi:dienelactone hydrolase